jgi:hypothetical protein
MTQLVRIMEATALDGLRLRLRLTDGRVIERDISALLDGPIFEPIRRDVAVFRQVRVDQGTVVWPNGADLCPDVLIWGGMPPVEAEIAGATPGGGASPVQPPSSA